MRVSISPRGSFTDMICLLLPARLDEAGDQAVVAQFPQRDTRHLQLAIIGTRTARHLAAVADSRLGRVARKRGKLDLGAKALFYRLALVHDDGLERGALFGEAIDH